jgi:hypothetical protein
MRIFLFTQSEGGGINNLQPRACLGPLHNFAAQDFVESKPAQDCQHFPDIDHGKREGKINPGFKNNIRRDPHIPVVEEKSRKSCLYRYAKRIGDVSVETRRIIRVFLPHPPHPGIFLNITRWC